MGGLSHISAETRSGCDFTLLLDLVSHLYQALRLPACGNESRAGNFTLHVAHKRGAAQAQRLFMLLAAALRPFVLEKIEGLVNAVENPGSAVFQGYGNGLLP